MSPGWFLQTEGQPTSEDHLHSEPTSVCGRAGLVAMVTVCLRLLALLPLVCCVPSSSRPPARICRRCCDFQDSPAPSAQHQLPEVRTVINMTILKGRQNHNHNQNQDLSLCQSQSQDQSRSRWFCEQVFGLSFSDGADVRTFCLLICCSCLFGV